MAANTRQVYFLLVIESIDASSVGNRLPLYLYFELRIMGPVDCVT